MMQINEILPGSVEAFVKNFQEKYGKMTDAEFNAWLSEGKYKDPHGDNWTREDENNWDRTLTILVNADGCMHGDAEQDEENLVECPSCHEVL